MKTVKRVAALLMVAFITAGLLMPVKAEAATTKPTVTFAGWANEEQSQCYLSVKNGGSDGYYYRIYVNGKMYKKNGKSVLSNRSICKVYGIPKNTIVTVSVRGVKQSNWSSRIVIAPVMVYGKALKASFPSSTSKKVKFTWTKITGATDYVVQISTNPSKGWTSVGRTTGTSMTVSKYLGKDFNFFTNYYFRVVCRKKVNGKYYGSKFPSKDWYANAFWFNKVYVQ